MNQIQGSFYVATDITVILDTEIQLAGADLEIVAQYPDGTLSGYGGTVVDFTKCQATITAADNTQAGNINLQVLAVFDGTTNLASETIQLTILNTFSPT